MISVTITECYGDRRTTTLRARTDDVHVAVERAIRKHCPAYGSRTRFVRDSDISVGYDALHGTQYGQIGHACTCGTRGCTRLDTGRVAIRAEAS